VAAVGVITPPDWHLSVPRLSMPDWIQIGELAFGLVVIVFAESWGSMRSLALLHGDELDANRELFALGTCNIASALLQGMPVGAGFSATSANAASGAKTRWAAVAAWVVIVGVIAFALPLLAQLPRPVLAVAVVNALWHALNPAPLVAVWRMNRDRLLMVAAVLAVLFLGVLHGMLVAIAMSILAAVKRFSEPVLHELGRLGSSRNFIAIAGQSQAQPVPGLLILRPEEPLFFASSERVATEILRQANARTDVHTVILSLEETADLDSTALECLIELDRHLRSAGKRLLLSRVKEPVRELLQRWCPEDLGHPERLYWSVADAVDRASKTGMASPHAGVAGDHGPKRSMS
jgi:MFS superfamily sulfate permease-like transporter